MRLLPAQSVIVYTFILDVINNGMDKVEFFWQSYFSGARKYQIRLAVFWLFPLLPAYWDLVRL